MLDSWNLLLHSTSTDRVNIGGEDIRHTLRVVTIDKPAPFHSQAKEDVSRFVEYFSLEQKVCQFLLAYR